MLDPYPAITASIIVGLWVAFATYVGDTRGAALGGTLAGLPSTAAFSLLFIGVAKSPQAASDATTAFPLTFSFTGSFLLIYVLLAGGKSRPQASKESFQGFLAVVFGSLGLWAALAYVAILVSSGDFILSLVLGSIVSFFLYFVSSGKMPCRMRGKPRNWHVDLVWRVPFASILVALAVLSGQILGPLTGGALAAFPAVFIASIVVTYKSGEPGERVKASQSICRPLMITSLMTVIPYSVVIRYLYPISGILIGTIVAYLVAVPFAFGAYNINRGEELGNRPSVRI